MIQECQVTPDGITMILRSSFACNRCAWRSSQKSRNLPIQRPEGLDARPRIRQGRSRPGTSIPGRVRKIEGN